MLELAVGTIFRYIGNLFMVVKVKDEYDRCSECDIFTYDCSMMDCGLTSREDGKNVCFKWVKE